MRITTKGETEARAADDIGTRRARDFARGFPKVRRYRQGLGFGHCQIMVQ